MAVEVNVDDRHPLPESVRVGCHRGHVGQEAAQDLLTGAADRERARPGPRQRLALVRAVERVLLLVQVRVRRVLVRVDRHQRRQAVAHPRAGARRILPLPQAVETEAQDARAGDAAVAPAKVAALDPGPVVAEALALRVEINRRLQTRPGRQGSAPGERAGPVTARRGAQARTALAGGAVDDVDDADEGGGAISHRRGAAQDLDAVHVGEIERLDGGIERATPGNAVHRQEERVELLEAPELRDRAGGPAVAARHDVDSGDQQEGAAQIVGAAAGQLVPRDHGHGGRRRAGRFRHLRGDDLHVLLVRRRDRLRGRLARQRHPRRERGAERQGAARQTAGSTRRLAHDNVPPEIVPGF